MASNPEDMVPIADQGALQRRWRIGGYEVVMTMDIAFVGQLVARAIASPRRRSKGGPVGILVRALAISTPEVKP
jgi:hypothetical protein